MDISAVPDREAQEFLRPNENPEPRTADDSGNKPDWGSTMSATVELLHGVSDGPLKSVAGRLCVILKNCEVWPSPHTFNVHCSRSFQRTEVDRQAIESLAPRVKILSESLCVPIPQGDVNEKQRVRKLER